MASLDSVSIAILLGAVLVMAGILSSLLALRFGAPLLLVFLLIGMLAGDSGPGRLQFDDVRTTYLVGSVALALILFDGGLKTRFASIRTVLAPSMVLATAGVLLTALITAPVARYVLDLNWTESLLLGAVVASTDAAAVFLLVHAQGLRLRPRVGATLEAESGTNDPFAVFLTLMLVELISSGQSSALHVVLEFGREAVLGAVIGVIGGRLVVLALNRVALPQGLHAPFVTTAALVIFGGSQIVHASGFLAVYLAGIIIGNRPTRAARSRSSWRRSRCWWDCQRPTSISTSPSSSSSSRCCCRAGRWPSQPAACTWRCRARIAGRGVWSLICPASWSSSWSAIPSARKACISGAGSFHPGRGRRW